MNAPSVTVVIPSFNGAQRLPNVLRCLTKQSDPDFETVVILDGSYDESEELLRSGAFSLQDLKMELHPNGGRAVARNRGFQASQGNIVLFLDDDMRPEAHIIAAHKAHHDQRPKTILVGGQVEQPEACKSDLDRYRCAIRRQWSAGLPQVKSRLQHPYMTAAHSSMPREVFEKLSGFNESLTDAEDYELAIRAMKSNVPIYFDPSLLAWHDDFITCKGYIKRRREYAKALRKVEALHGPSDASSPAIAPNVSVKKALHWPWVHPFWVWAVEDESWITLLPKSVRYRIYSAVLWGYGEHYPDRPLP